MMEPVESSTVADGVLKRLWYATDSRGAYLGLCSRAIHGLTVCAAGLPFYSLTEFWKVYVLQLILVLLVFQAAGLYGEMLFSSLLRLRRIALAWAVTFLLCIFLMQQLHPFILRDHPVPLVKWFALGLLLLWLERLLALSLYHWLMQRGVYLQRAIILGVTDNGLRMAHHLLEHRDFRCGLLGFVDDRAPERLPENLTGLPLLGSTRYLRGLIGEARLETVFVALPWSAERRVDQLVRQLKRMPINVLLVPDLVALRYAHLPMGEIAGIHLVRASHLALHGWAPLLKRAEDLVLGSLALLVLALPMAFIALAVKLDSPGPVLFRQKRYGYNDQLIQVFKFRTMFHEAVDAPGVRQTVRGDPRVTRVGRWLRRLSLDELPQLFNVLGGSMSLVGPRPHATATQAAGMNFEDAVMEYSARHRVRPGMTGWAQINGLRGETDTLDKIERRIEYDLRYIEQWSLWLDLYILCRTVPALIWTRTAY